MRASKSVTGNHCIAAWTMCRLIQLLPEDPSGYSNRSYAYRKLGDYTAAVDDYTRAINLTGTGSTRLHNNRYVFRAYSCCSWLQHDKHEQHD